MKKECPAKDFISPFMDGELPPEKMTEMEVHLETCEACQKEMRLLNAAEHLLTGLPEVAPSEAFERSFRQKLYGPEKKKAWSFSPFSTFRWQPYFATALVMLIIAGFAMYYRNQNSGIPDTDDIFMSEHMELFQDYETIDNLDLLENWDAIAALEEES